jgi:triacylglycerol lipase
MRFCLLVIVCLPAASCSATNELIPPVIDGGEAPAQQQPHSYPTGTVDGGADRIAYPMVLCHGFTGFEKIGPISYFYGVAEALRADGHEVYTPVVDPYNSSEIRGAELQKQVEAILASTGAAKVNLICHSQGGLDCRYVASNLGERVASVVTIATPHHGTPVADIATGDLPGPVKAAVDALLNLIGAAISGGKGDQDSDAALKAMSSAGALAFGRAHPDDPRVAYYSIAGRSNMASGDDTCGSATQAPFVARWNSYLDQVDALLSPTGTILSNNVSPPPSNDGLVPVGSAHYGTFLGCIPADHFDEVCQIAGDVPGNGNKFDCVLFYRQLAEWLVARGY